MLCFFFPPETQKVVEIIKIDDTLIITISTRKLIKKKKKTLGLLSFLFTDNNPQIFWFPII